MKLNDKQKTALLLLLGKYGEIVPLHEVVENFDRFCNEEIREWRVFGKFGFAGKLWNNHNRIYVSGHSPSEMAKADYLEQQKEISRINDQLSEALEDYK